LVQRGTLWLSLVAYNLGNLWRRLVLPAKIDKWSLTSLQQRLVKTGVVSKKLLKISGFPIIAFGATGGIGHSRTEAEFVRQASQNPVPM
jgi:hypothetical protein